MPNQGNKGNQGGSTRGGTRDQHAEAGRQSHKNDASNRNSGDDKSARGGTPEQHAAAGRQSHKNDDKR